MTTTDDEGGEGARRGGAGGVGLARLFGARVRAAREGAGMTRLALARAAGLSHDTLERVERGEYGVKLHSALALAAALGVPLAQLTAEGEGDGQEK